VGFHAFKLEDTINSEPAEDAVEGRLRPFSIRKIINNTNFNMALPLGTPLNLSVIGNVGRYVFLDNPHLKSSCNKCLIGL